MELDMRKLQGFKLRKSHIVYAGLAAALILLNGIAWSSTAFCDGYIKYIFPIWVNTYGRFMNLFSFSVGEILLFGAVGLTVLLLIIALTGILLVIFKKLPRIRRICKYYTTFYAWLVLLVCLIMTLNCSILYHASTFSEKYFGVDNEEYTLEDLIKVRNLVVDKCNAFSGQMVRDENGEIVYEKDIRQEAIKAMQALGETYDQLDGYYPRPKPLATSDFFSQQYMCGYYFPFSMEANYNDVMYIMNKPATMCHELAHLRGYIFEDEANFISYLACIESEDPVIQYSGYLSVLYYLDNDYYKAVGRNWDTYISQPRILEQVDEDNVFLTQEEWDRIEDKAVLDTETVDEVSDAFTETVLKANGVSDGMISYSRVVKLLLQYYEVQGLMKTETL